jgi:hypothetical protein
MADARAKHLKRLRRLRRSARGWSVRSGLLAGATAVLVPYAGLGVYDAIWAAAAGGSMAVTFWRWADFRSLAAQPVPEPVDPALAGAAARDRLMSVVRSTPIGRSALGQLRRQHTALRFRATAVGPWWRRLDRASATLAGLSARLGPAAGGAVLEATAAEHALRDLAERTASVERAMRLRSGGATLRPAHEALVTQLGTGVAAYEQFVAAAASCVAYEDAAVGSLSDATAYLRGVAEALSELGGTEPRAA